VDTTVATGNDSVKLPAVLALPAGTEITVANAHASNSLNVFPATGDAIDALGVNAARAVAAGKVCTFTTISAGQCHSMLGA
jgi:hypothetical protein